MSELNPYQPPSALIKDAEVRRSHGNFIPAGRKLAADRGTTWLTGGFKMVFAQVGPWLLLTLVLGVIFIVLGLIPIVGLVVNLLMPVFIGGMLIAARRQAEGGTVEIGDIFGGFKEKFGPLIIVGLLMFVMSLVLLLCLIVPILGMSLSQAWITGDAEALAGRIGTILLVFPGVVLIGAVVSAAWWLAPALIVFHDIAPVEAMKRSFIATLKNWAPVLIFSLLTMLAMFCGMLLIGLGLFIVMPALATATYLAYRDIFIQD